MSSVNPNDIKKIRVFHGTSYHNFSSIKENNFEISEGDEHLKWLGNGAYFFTDGVSPNPEYSAKEWAIVSSFNNFTKRIEYTKYCVVEAEVQVSESSFLDLTTPDGLAIFNAIKDKFYSFLRQNGLEQKRGVSMDGDLIEFFATKKEVNVVKGNFYIQLDKYTRINKIQFKTPNCTILSVRNIDCISKDSIKIFSSGIIT